MSIINQTLRELDARKPGSVSSQIPLRPVAAIPHRRSVLWAAAGVLLSIAGLGVWAMWKPAASVPAAPTGSIQRAAVPHATRPVSSSAPPVVAPAPTPVSVQQPVAVVAAPAARQPIADIPLQARTKPGKSAEIAAMSQPMNGSASPGGEAPVIRKKVEQPTAEETADERYRKAMTLVRNGLENQARPLLEEAIELYPGHAAAREALAALLSEGGENGEAETVLREGRAVAPDNARLALGLARLQAARGDMEGAVTTLQSGIGGRGVGAEYHATLAAVLVRLKHYPEAAQQYEQALKLKPGQGTWWMGLGLAWEAQGKTDEAHSAYRRALAAGNLPEKLAEFVRAQLVE